MSDLESPTRFLAWHTPYPCQVCGRKRQPSISPRALWRRDSNASPAHDHDVCDQKIRDWEKQVEAVYEDARYIAALTEVTWHQSRADRIWEEKLRALGLPEWMVERALRDYQDRGRDE